MPTSRPASHTHRPVHPKPGQVIIVMNPDDDVAVATHLAAVHDVGQGRVVVCPRDTRTRSAQRSLDAARKRLGTDLLAALDKNPDDIARHRGQALALAGSWLRGERVQDLVVDRAHALPGQLLLELAAFARDAQIRLWLIWVADPPQRPDTGAVKTLTITARQFRDALPAPPAGPATAQPAPPDWPDVPSSDFPVFMQVCRARLDPADFRRIAQTFDLAQEAADELANQFRIGTTERQRVSQVEVWLRDQMLTGDQHPSQLLVTLRGVQAGFFAQHLFLRWRMSLLPSPAQAHLPTRLTDDVARRLRRLCAPDEAAALVIQLHLAADPRTFQLRDLSTDGATLTQQQLRYSEDVSVQHRFPRSAHSILATHLAQRHRDGAEDDSPLFADVPPPGRHKALRQRFGPAPMPADSAACSTPWLAERGLSLHGIDIREIQEKRR